jgi:osmotically-inducible protein OsmY
MDNPAISVRVESAAPLAQVISDSDLRSRAVSLLRWKIRYNSIRVEAEKGHVILSGQVDSFFDSDAAEQTIRKLSGVRGVTNRIAISARVARLQYTGA